MNRFAEAIHGVKVWLQLMNIKPEGVEVVIRFRDPSELYGAERQLARDTDPLAATPAGFYGNYRKGTMMGMRYSLEGPGMDAATPHAVAEALRKLATEVDRIEPRRTYVEGPSYLHGTLDKPFIALGDVVGPYAPSEQKPEFNPDDTTK